MGVRVAPRYPNGLLTTYHLETREVETTRRSLKIQTKKEKDEVTKSPGDECHTKMRGST